ncbi:MAG: cupin domain-containing protein [Candidatus Thermoplasmatota archaeon]
MEHKHYSEVKLEKPTEKGVKDVKLRWLISKKDKAENFAMRLFEIKANGYTPFHHHDWEHEVYILEGKGKIKNKDNKKDINKGDFLFIPPNEWHQFINDSDEKLKFLCLVPIK